VHNCEAVEAKEEEKDTDLFAEVNLEDCIKNVLTQERELPAPYNI
jgi:hypothetical protein